MRSIPLIPLPRRSSFPALPFVSLLVLTLALAACTPRHGATLPVPPVPPAPQVEDKAAQIWQRFEARANTAEVMTGPFRISANLRYTDSAGKNTRVSSLLWGNGKAGSPHPLRLDLLAGVGTVVAKVREDSSSFTAFSPGENTARVHQGGARTLASFGVPIPLSLSDLTMLLSGRGGLLFIPATLQNDAEIPPEHALTENGARYAVPGAKLPGEVEISETGAPIAWKERVPGGWSIEIEPDEVNPLLPITLRISHPKGYSALIVVKDIARVSPPYSIAQMDLVIPPGTLQEPLDQQNQR